MLKLLAEADRRWINPTGTSFDLYEGALRFRRAFHGICSLFLWVSGREFSNASLLGTDAFESSR